MNTVVTDRTHIAGPREVTSTAQSLDLDERDRRNLIRLFGTWRPTTLGSGTSEPERTPPGSGTGHTFGMIEARDIDIQIKAWTDVISQISPNREDVTYSFTDYTLMFPEHRADEATTAYHTAAAWLMADSLEGKPSGLPTYVFTPFYKPPHQQDQSNPWLVHSLEDLDLTEQEARDEGNEPPAELAKLKAREILEAAASMGQDLPDPAVYPTEDREVAIAFQIRANKSSVLVLCDSNGGGACFSYISQKRGRARFDDASDLVTDFLQGQLKRLTNS